MFCFFHTKSPPLAHVIWTNHLPSCPSLLRLLKQCSGWWPVSQVRVGQRVQPGAHPPRGARVHVEKSFPTRVQGLLEVYMKHQMIVVFFSSILIGHERIFWEVVKKMVSAFRKKLPNKDCWAGIRHFVSDSIFRLVFFVVGPQWSPLQ